MLTPGIEAMSLGMRREFASFDLLSQNIANAETPGFRAVLMGHREGTGLDRWIGQSTPAPALTERNMDVCPAEGSYLSVLKNGKEQYTRRGDLRVDPSGVLVIGSGQPVLSSDGSPIRLNQRETVSIDSSGAVVQKGKTVATLRRTALERPSGSGGSSIFELPPGATTADTSEPIQTGSLESSDVDTTQDSVRLAESLARARMFQGFAQAQDQTVEQAIRDLGSSRS